MDADGQHEPEAVQRAVDRLLAGDLDLVMGSRFHPEASIAGLSASRQKGSERANQLARFSLPAYAQLSDYMSGFFALRLERCNSAIRAVDVSGFKFLYELLAVSKGQLKVEEIPSISATPSGRFQARQRWFGIGWCHWCTPPLSATLGVR